MDIYSLKELLHSVYKKCNTAGDLLSRAFLLEKLKL